MNSQPSLSTLASAAPIDAPVIFPDNIGAGQSLATKPKRKRRADRKSAAELHLDCDLIEACIDFAKHVASARAASEVDPSGNDDFGAFHYDIGRRDAEKALKFATETNAITFDGLRAKATLVAVIFNDLEGASPLDAYHEEFLRAFAADVVRAQTIVLRARATHHAIEDLESVKT